MDINEVNRQLDMCIRHFKAVNIEAKKAAIENQYTSFAVFQNGRADIAKEAVNWLKQVKKNIAK